MAFLSAIEAGTYVHALIDRRGMPRKEDLRERRKSDPAFEAAYFAARNAANAARVASGAAKQSQQWGLKPDWEKFLIDLAAGGYVQFMVEKRPNPTKQELAARVAKDKRFATRFSAAKRQGHLSRVARGLVQLDNTVEVDWERFEERVAAGEPILAVVGGYEMPSRSQVYRRRQKDRLFSQRLSEIVTQPSGVPKKATPITAELMAAIDAALPRRLSPDERDEVRQEVTMDIMQRGVTESVKERVAAAVSRVMQTLYGDAVSLDDLAEKGFDPTGGTLPWARSKRAKSSPSSGT